MKYSAKKDLLLWRNGGRVSEYSIFLRPRPISKASAQNRLSNQEFFGAKFKIQFFGFLTLMPSRAI